MADISLVPLEHRVVNSVKEIRVHQYVPWITYCTIKTWPRWHISGREARQKAWEQTLDALFFGLRQFKYITSEGRTAPLTPQFFRDRNNWVNNAINLFLFGRVAEFLGRENDSRLWFELAEFSLRSREMSQEQIKNRLMGGPHGTYANIPEENKEWNDTKDVVAANLTDHSFVFELHYSPTITRDAAGRAVSRYVCYWNQGIYRVIPTLFNKWWTLPHHRLSPARIEETYCTVNGDQFCQFEGGYYNEIKDPVIKLARIYFLGQDAEKVKKAADILQTQNKELQRRVEIIDEKAQRLATDLAITQADLELGSTLEAIMHLDSNLLIVPIAGATNAFADFQTLWAEYRHQQTEENLDAVLSHLEFASQRMAELRTVADMYRATAKARHELLISKRAERDINQDLGYVRDLMTSGFGLTKVSFLLEQSSYAPQQIRTRSRIQAAFLELALNAAKHGQANEVLVRTEYLPPGEHPLSRKDLPALGIHFYNNGRPIAEPDRIFEPEFSTTGSTGMGLHRVKARLEYDGGIARLEPNERPGFNVHFGLYLPLSQ